MKHTVKVNYENKYTKAAQNLLNKGYDLETVIKWWELKTCHGVEIRNGVAEFWWGGTDRKGNWFQRDFCIMEISVD